MLKPLPGPAMRQNFLTKLAALTSLVSAVTGALRVYGAFRSLPLWQAQGYPGWVLPYLFLAGLAQLVLSLLAWNWLRKQPSGWLSKLWAANLAMLALYWVERLLLWSADERGGNIMFIALVHALWLGLLGLITVQARKKEPLNG